MTKLLSLSLVALLAAGAVSAQPTFSLNRVQDRDTQVELGTVRAPAAGVVELYDLDGTLIGSEALRAGVNSDVRVSLSTLPDQKVVAVIKVDGATVAQQSLRFDR